VSPVFTRVGSPVYSIPFDPLATVYETENCPLFLINYSGGIMMQDRKLIKIKKVIKNIFPECKIILFGSKTYGDADEMSDYDILVIFKQDLSIKEKRYYASFIQKKLASIPLDVIVKTEMDTLKHLKRIESVVKEAIEIGVVI
jgi:predicted nucleotidyltransferase